MTFQYSRHIPKVFTDGDISIITDTILTSQDLYMPTILGDFLRWRDITAIQLMYYAGLRPAECLQLKWCDIDSEKRFIHVRPYVNKIKNDLPAILTKPAERVLLRYKQKCEEYNIRNEWIFPSVWTWKALARTSMARRFTAICKEAKIIQLERHDARGKPKYTATLYDLRHSFCTKIYKKTASEIAVSRLARHTQVQSASIYTHLNFEDKLEIADNVFQ